MQLFLGAQTKLNVGEIQNKLPDKQQQIQL